MDERDPDEFTRKYWPGLLIACCLLVLWYVWGGNVFAGVAGFFGLGWLAWLRLIKPGM